MIIRNFYHQSVVFLGIIFFQTLHDASSFTLEGSQTSYAQFRKWYVGVNGTLSLEFQTTEPNGLLCYTDDGGSYDFFEIKLVDGSVRLRYNVGGGATVLTLGRNLNDNRWHRVDIYRKYNETRLIIDGEFQNKVVRGNDQNFGNFSTNSYVYIGGLPSWFSSKLDHLALPSVVFEPRFRGNIRNVIYSSEDTGLSRRQDMIEFKGVRSNELDQCERQDPCQNAGICISTDTGTICDCKAVDFEGAFCQKSKSPSEVTFRGSEYLSYNLLKTGGEAIVSSTEIISLYFKTRHPDGLLFFTGDGEDFLNLAVKNGGVVVTMGLGPGTQEKTVKPSRVRFDDNHWHKITVLRKIQEITRVISYCLLSVNVDGVYMETGSAAGSFSLLSSNVMYVGGSDKTPSLPGSRVSSNFKGCIRKVQFKADSLDLNILELARSGNNLIEKHGNINFQCQEVEAADPITFTTQESFLILPSWKATRSGSLSFKMRTNEPDGLLMYNAGASKSVSDFFAFELMDGHVYLLMNLGSGVAKVKATSRRIDDGHWHTVSLRRHNKSGRVAVDELATDFNTPGNSNQLDLKGELLLGGIGTSIENVQIPSEMWSGHLGYGYVGCIRDLVVNGNAIDIAEYAKKQDSGSIKPACHSLPPQCDSQPCTNNGRCSEGWNRFICDCTATEFTGPVCAKYATTLSFDGSQHMKMNLMKESSTQAEDIVLRFKSNRPNGILLNTHSDKAVDKTLLYLDTGSIKLSINVGDGYTILHSGQGLNDNQWHTVNVVRRGKSLSLKVDNEPEQHDEINGAHETLDLQKIFIGSAKQAKGHHHTLPNFIGLMQQLVFNGKHYFDLARNGLISNFEVTAKFGKKEQAVHHPVTFKNKESFVGLPQLKAYSSMNLYFQFKTFEANGLIMYHAGKGQDFLAIELVNGHLSYIFNIGDGSRRVKSNTRSTLNDNQWHAVTIGRPSLRQHSLMVDDMIATVTSTGSNIHLDLDGVLYLGGVPNDMFNSHNLPRVIKSKQGFEGCIGSLDLNGETPDPIVDAVIPNEDVLSGCAGPSTKCSINACSNKGVCIQFWNKYSCDCDMTSYTGSKCSDESIAYQFGRGRGLITYTYPANNRPDLKTDLLALGILTYSDNAIIARVDSSRSRDYLEMEIVEGNVFVVYNMGTENHPIQDFNVKINDGRYHVIRFTRSGSNSTLQIDNHPVQMKNPKGQLLNVFNSQSKIQIGGKRNSIKGTIDRPFNGVIAGFVFNSKRILDKASVDDRRIKLSGDVELLMSIPFDKPQAYRAPEFQMMKEKPASYSGIDDDLVYSGGGSACADDEDNCFFINSGSGDDLVTPVYVPPPAPKFRKTTTPKPIIRKQPSKPCSEDDEDCLDSGGSGFQEISVPQKKSTPRPVSEIRKTKRPIPSRSPSTRTSLIIKPTISVEVVSSSDEFFATDRPETDVGIVAPIDISTNYRPIDTFDRYPSNIDHGFDKDFVDRSSRGKKRKNKSRSAETLTLIVGIVASVMIAVVIIAFLVYRVRSKPEGAYKMDEGKSYRYQSETTPLPNSASGYVNDFQNQYNGTLRNGDKAGKLPKKKDIKEWYV